MWDVIGACVAAVIGIGLATLIAYAVETVKKGKQ